MRKRLVQVGALALTLLFLGYGAWGVGWWFEEGRPGKEEGAKIFRSSPLEPIPVVAGRPRQIPLLYRGFRLTGRVTLPRGRTMDLVFRLQLAPRGGEPLEWSALRLSAADVGKPFFWSRRIPPLLEGGIRVPPGLPTNVMLQVEGRRVEARVGDRLLTGPCPLALGAGKVALVGSGSWEALEIRPLLPRLGATSLLPAVLLLLLLLLPLALLLRGFLPGWILLPGGALLLALAGHFLKDLEGSSPEPPPVSIEEAPAFRTARELYGEAEGWRNWGAYAGSLTWRGRTAFRRPITARRRLVVLGGEQVWGAGLTEKMAALPLQVEGWLERLLPASPGWEVLVGACRETDLARQVEIFRRDLVGYGVDLVLLVCPPPVRESLEGKRLLAFSRELARQDTLLLVVPPLVPPEGARRRARVAELLALRRQGGFNLFDPLDGEEPNRKFFAPGTLHYSPFPPLTREAHLFLGERLARHLHRLLDAGG